MTSTVPSALPPEVFTVWEGWRTSGNHVELFRLADFESKPWTDLGHGVWERESDDGRRLNVSKHGVTVYDAR